LSVIEHSLGVKRTVRVDYGRSGGHGNRPDR
jgi:hypothetical protein